MGSGYGSAKSVLKTVVTYDRNQWRWRAGLRSAAGLGIPLILGILLRQPIPAITVTVGALVTGFASLNGTLRKRFRTMRTAMVWMGVATALGAALGHWTLAIVLVSLVSGFGAGLAVSAGLETMQIGTLATTALIIFSAFPEPWPIALQEGFLVMLGSGIQIVLLWLLQVIEPSLEEERGIVAVLDAMMAYLEEPGSARNLDIAWALLHAEAQLNDSNLPVEHWTRLKEILDRLDVIRNDILAETDISLEPDQQVEIGWILNRLGAIRVIFTGKARANQVRRDPLAVNVSEASRASHLATQLETVFSLARGALPDLETWPEPPSRHRHRLWSRMRANLTVESQAFRHAIRLAVTLAIAVFLYRVVPLSRGYWVPITILVVLRPDFQATFGRGLARVLGTAIGILLATGLLVLAAPDTAHVVGVLLVLGFGLALYASLNVNYALFSVFVTAMVVVLLSFFEHAPVGPTLQDRLLNTVIGSGIALGAYALWPTWQRERVPGVLAEWLHDERDYLSAVGTPGSDVASARKALRLSRTNAVAVLGQALNEPVTNPLDPIQLGKFTAALHHVTEILMTLEFTLPREIGNSAAKERFLTAIPEWCDQLDLLARAWSQDAPQRPPSRQQDPAPDVSDYWENAKRQLEADIAAMWDAYGVTYGTDVGVSSQ